MPKQERHCRQSMRLLLKPCLAQMIGERGLQGHRTAEKVARRCVNWSTLHGEAAEACCSCPIDKSTPSSSPPPVYCSAKASSRVLFRPLIIAGGLAVPASLKCRNLVTRTPSLFYGLPGRP